MAKLFKENNHDMALFPYVNDMIDVNDYNK